MVEVSMEKGDNLLSCGYSMIDAGLLSTHWLVFHLIKMSSSIKLDQLLFNGMKNISCCACTNTHVYTYALMQYKIK